MNVYSEEDATTALTIWENCCHPGRSYNWITQDKGIGVGRHNALNLAPIVESIYDWAVSLDHATVSHHAFDIELVPKIIKYMMQLELDPSAGIPTDLQKEIAKKLIQELKNEN